mmetsp:Transcript_63839/g.175251  ORF Transcript_63839/g.175251 Transcript_63839/m.175251 type:complete len:120 (+) Transcript_63839:77-436(+)
MGAGASALNVQETPLTDDLAAAAECATIMDSICQQDGIDYYAADTATTAARLFVELDTEQINKLDVENLVAVAVEYFSTQLTVQPEKWIRTQIEKQDEDRDGWLDQEQFERAVNCLRRC